MNVCLQGNILAELTREKLPGAVTVKETARHCDFQLLHISPYL
jgi:hypothetical protein